MLVGEADIGAAVFFVDGHFRNDGHTHPHTYHAEEAAELAAFENDAGVKSRSVAGGQGCVAEAVAIAKKEKRFGANVFERERRFAAETVVSWQCGEKVFGEDGEGVEFVAADGKGKNREVDGGGAKAFEKDGGDFLDNRKFGLRELARKRGKVRRQEVRSHGGNHADGNDAADGVFLFVDIATCGLEFAENGTSARQKGLAEFGQTDRTA